jgi:hypothetical protein
LVLSGSTAVVPSAVSISADVLSALIPDADDEELVDEPAVVPAIAVVVPEDNDAAGAEVFGGGVAAVGSGGGGGTGLVVFVVDPEGDVASLALGVDDVELADDVVLVVLGGGVVVVDAAVLVVEVVLVAAGVAVVPVEAVEPDVDASVSFPAPPLKTTGMVD